MEFQFDILVIEPTSALNMLVPPDTTSSPAQNKSGPFRGSNECQEFRNKSLSK
jgi:hypothetical protein